MVISVPGHTERLTESYVYIPTLNLPLQQGKQIQRLSA